MNHIKVAIADDHQLILMSLVQHVNNYKNCEVILQAGNGLELLHLLETARELPNVCILDIGMPGLNGFETLIMLQNKYQDIKVIGLSALNNEYTILKMLQCGAKAYLTKNCTSEELQNAIYALANGKCYYSVAASREMFDKAKKTALPTFSERELTFLNWCCKHLKYNEIAREMFVSDRTVENYYNSISKKIGIRDKSALIAWAKDSGLVYSNHFLA